MVHFRSLSLYHILNIFVEHTQEPTLRCILFTNDIVLFKESGDDINGRLNNLRQILETCDFRLNRSKTKYMNM